MGDGIGYNCPNDDPPDVVSMWPCGKNAIGNRPGVTIDEQGVVRTLTGGKEERVKWDELQEAWLMTTADGPFDFDVFWVLLDRSRGCVVPQGLPEADAILERLQLLPGFDNKAVVSAMSSVEDAWFQCWDRDWKGSPPPPIARPGKPRLLTP